MFISRVRELLELSADERRQMDEACEHDIEFEFQLDEPRFQFRYPDLPASCKQVAKNLMSYFYDEILVRGAGFSGMDGQQIDPLDRTALELAYYRANELGDMTRICPACLGRLELRRPDMVFPKSHVECEHYFPKSSYPFLAIHPANLIFICKTCNHVHNQQNPINADAAQANLPGAIKKCFLPYTCTGLSRDPGLDGVRLDFVPSTPHNTVRLLGNGSDPAAVERAANVNRIYNLAQRWSLHLPGVHATIRRALQTEGTYASDTRKVLDAVLNRMVDQSALRLCSEDALLESEYAKWLRKSENFDNLHESLVV